MMRRLIKRPVASNDPDGLIEGAWELADELDWARTFDAEYLALARRLNCPLVTLDPRPRRGADRTGRVLTPGELTYS